MMSVLHLLWIIPVAFVIGGCCGMAEAAMDSRNYDEFGEELWDDC